MNRDVCEHFSPQELCAECNHSAICMCQQCRDVESIKLCERLIMHSIYVNEKTRGMTIPDFKQAIEFLFDEKIIAAAIDKFRSKTES